MRGCLFPARVARKNPFIAWRQKAYLNFELKDHGPNRSRLLPRSALKMSKSDKSDLRLAAALRAVLDFKVQIRSGLPCDEWGGVARGGPLSVWHGSAERHEVLSRAWYLIQIIGAMRWAPILDTGKSQSE